MNAYVHHAERILAGKSLPLMPPIPEPTKEELEEQEKQLSEIQKRSQAEGFSLADFVMESLGIVEIAPGVFSSRFKSVDEYVEWVESQDPDSHFRGSMTEEQRRNFIKKACAELAVDRLMGSEEEE